ncbi:hypothetical protein EYC79_16980 [Agrobacterium cavarae]|uniref:Uncharacterized protein n=1 Tax=Agrobacterium cavarae TaxID=2528239 RepID=A0ABY1Y4R6_9HYPH|nr:hypothetical protein [Agrobacterium cavarae]TBN10658.1 hypothetical protein EYC79_16980 [Agrobacterium cavarae]
MLHRDNGGEPKRVEASSAGSAFATRKSGCASAATIRALPYHLDRAFSPQRGSRLHLPQETSLKMFRLSDGWGRMTEVVSLKPYVRCGPAMGISSLLS